MGGCEDFLPESFKFGAGAIGVESGGDGMGDAIEDEGFAELEPVGEVLANFFMGCHDVLWVKEMFLWYSVAIGAGGKKVCRFFEIERLFES